MADGGHFGFGALKIPPTLLGEASPLNLEFKPQKKSNHQKHLDFLSTGTELLKITQLEAGF